MMNLSGLTWTSKDEELFKLLSAAKDPVPGEPSAFGVVALVGETQCGKSRLITHWAREIEDCQVVYWNPQTDSPEDIGGFPHRDRGVIRWTQPSIIPPEVMDKKGGWILFIDELDKAQEDVLSCALTLLSERRIRDKALTPTAVVCALNPPKRALPPPLLARLLFVPYPPRDYNVFERSDLNGVSGMLGDILKTPDPAIPQLPSTFGGGHRLQAWMRDSSLFWESDYCKRSVVEGTFSQQHSETIIGRLQEQSRLPVVEWAQQSDPSELASGLLDVLHTTHQQLRKDYVRDAEGKLKSALPDDVLSVVKARAERDKTGEVTRVLDAFFNTPQAMAAQERGATPAMLAAGKQAMVRKWATLGKEDK